MKTTVAQGRPHIESPVEISKSDPIFPVAVTYIIAVGLLTATCTFFWGDPLVSLALAGLSITGSLNFILNVFLVYKKLPEMPKRPRKIAGLWRRRSTDSLC